MTILQGGWRLAPPVAFGAMLQALSQNDAGGPAVTLCCFDEALADPLRGQAWSWD